MQGGLVDHGHSQRLSLLELAPGFFAGEDVACFFAHTAAHRATVTADQLGDFVARAAEGAGEDPNFAGQFLLSGRGAFVAFAEVEAMLPE